jgi:hypothetical protein
MNILREIRVLREEGKLHRKLIMRTRIFLVISAVLLGATIFNVVAREADWRWIVGLFAGGLSLGLLVFSRMSVVQWNEKAELVETGRMDTLGYLSLALYIGSEISLRTFLDGVFPGHAIAYLLAGIAGTLLGRAFGSLYEMHRVYLAAHPAS